VQWRRRRLWGTCRSAPQRGPVLEASDEKTRADQVNLLEAETDDRLFDLAFRLEIDAGVTSACRGHENKMAHAKRLSPRQARNHGRPGTWSAAIRLCEWS
jgi:hypothetical protein